MFPPIQSVPSCAIGVPIPETHKDFVEVLPDVSGMKILDLRTGHFWESSDEGSLHAITCVRCQIIRTIWINSAGRICDSYHSLCGAVWGCFYVWNEEEL